MSIRILFPMGNTIVWYNHVRFFLSGFCDSSDWTLVIDVSKTVIEVLYYGLLFLPVAYVPIADPGSPTIAACRRTTPHMPRRNPAIETGPAG